MRNSDITVYEDIDWRTLWQNSRKQKSWRSKDAEGWDRKASSFAERNQQSPYAHLFISRLPLAPEYTVLDIGCGPGTIALPIARHVQKVTAVDYSQKMLDLLAEEAQKTHISNITTVHCAWEDDWHSCGISPADIAIASRSMNVADLDMAIDKLNSFAGKYVFITDRISPSPFDPDAFAAIGRPFQSGPDYIYTLNFLYNKGIHPCVEILELDCDIHFQDEEKALQSYRWMFKELNPAEERKLAAFVSSSLVRSDTAGVTLRRRHPPRWAMIWWKK
ncbi:MAG: class I SAM-dependent methyltransferase [Desulfopila sp.]|nr:class I SAM-dependent methyltransferase [Desulfopila sp.]